MCFLVSIFGTLKFSQIACFESAPLRTVSVAKCLQVIFIFAQWIPSVFRFKHHFSFTSSQLSLFIPFVFLIDSVAWIAAAFFLCCTFVSQLLLF